jgi:hypothetical protein
MYRDKKKDIVLIKKGGMNKRLSSMVKPKREKN